MSQSPTIDGIELVLLLPGRNLAPRVHLGDLRSEQRAIFARSCTSPTCATFPAAVLRHRHDRRLTPVMALRDPVTGDLRAFVNACRHRGAQLLGQGVRSPDPCPTTRSYGPMARARRSPRDEFTCDRRR
jgi:hypothetical protein